MENLLKSGLVIFAIILSANSFGQKQERKTDLPVCPVKREVNENGNFTKVIQPAKKGETVMKMSQLQSTLPSRKSSGNK